MNTFEHCPETGRWCATEESPDGPTRIGIGDTPAKAWDARRTWPLGSVPRERQADLWVEDHDLLTYAVENADGGPDLPFTDEDRGDGVREDVAGFFWAWFGDDSEDSDGNCGWDGPFRSGSDAIASMADDYR